MKHLLFDNGGRPLNNDDFVTLQDEIYYAVNGQLLGLPACVVSGCDVTSNGNNAYNISHGLVYVEGEIRRFEGVTDVALPQELYAGPFETTETRAYQTGGSKATMGEAVVLARPYDAATPGWKVLVKPEGVLRVAKAREGLFREVGEGGFLFDIDTKLYDNTGRGLYGTKAYGWQLANGKGSAPDMQGRFPVGVGGAGDYSAPRKTGGAEKVALSADQNGRHTHSMESGGEHQHGVPTRAGDGNNNIGRRGNDTTNDGQLKTDRAGSHTHTINESGAGAAHENRPPYLAVAFRMWVGF